MLQIAICKKKKKKKCVRELVCVCERERGIDSNREFEK